MAREEQGRALGRLALPLALTAAVLAVSTAAPAIRLAAPFAPEVIASLRVSVTALVLVLSTWASTRSALRSLVASPREAGMTILAGVCLAAHFAAWIASLSLTSVLRSVALVSTQPLFAGLLARALGDRAPARLVLGTALAIGGTLIMLVDLDGLDGLGRGAWFGSPSMLTGDLLALSGAVTAAVYLAIGRHVHARLGEQLPLQGYFACVNVVAAGSLVLLALARGGSLAPSGAVPGDVLAIVWLGLVPGIVGHGLLNWAVRRVPVHVVSLAVLLEPAGAAVFGWMLLGEGVDALEAAGALVLIVGVGVGLPRRRS